jgi:hypothetical protein
MLSKLELQRRVLTVQLASDDLAAGTEKLENVLRDCRESQLDESLRLYRMRPNSACARSARSHRTIYAAPIREELLLSVRCHNPSVPYACSIKVPFNDFSDDVSFAHEHLPRWRELVERTTQFLISKQYR